MSNFIQFDPVFSLGWLVAGTVALIVLLGWRESRQIYRFRSLRVAAQSIALLALLGLALRPSYSLNVAKPPILLLTENYLRQSADSLRSRESNLLVVSAPGMEPIEGVTSIRSYHAMTLKGRLKFVAGDGVDISALDILSEAPFVFIPGRKPTGIIELSSGPYEENRRSWIRGVASDMKNASIRLVGPGGLEDSIRIRSKGEEKFALKFSTKQAGRYVYSLLVVDSLGKRTEQAIPVEVNSSRKLSVLILQTYPQPEIRFLKNYLADKGHVVVTRYQLSKNTFRFEWANGGGQKFNAISSSILQEYDLVVSDDESVGQLATSESMELENAVREGLGLLLLLQRPPDSGPFPGNVLGLRGDVDAPDTIRFTVPDFGSFVSPYVALRTDRGARIQPVLMSGRSLLSGFVLHGEGKVGFQALRESYRLSLSGETAPFAALWTPLLEQVARRLDQRLQARVTTLFPIYPEDPVHFELLTEKSPSVELNGIRIPVAEDVRVDGLWHGVMWNAAPGWNELTLNGNSSRVNYFISNAGSWKSLRMANQRRSNIQASVRENVGKDEEWTIQKTISPIMFFLVFLFALGFVWLAPKV